MLILFFLQRLFPTKNLASAPSFFSIDVTVFSFPIPKPSGLQISYFYILKTYVLGPELVPVKLLIFHSALQDNTNSSNDGRREEWTRHKMARHTS